MLQILYWSVCSDSHHAWQRNIFTSGSSFQSKSEFIERWKAQTKISIKARSENEIFFKSRHKSKTNFRKNERSYHRNDALHYIVHMIWIIWYSRYHMAFTIWSADSTFLTDCMTDCMGHTVWRILYAPFAIWWTIFWIILGCA